MYAQIRSRIYLASIIVPILIYWYVWEDSEGVNDRRYLPKRVRNSGYKRMKNTLWTCIREFGQRIIDHAENISIKHQATVSARKNLSRRSSKRGLVFAAMAALACQAQKTHWEHKVLFDTDSYDIGIDNRCSACISGTPEDFIGPLKDSTRTIKGFMGTKTTNVKVGTLLWKWLDDEGKLHQFHIPNSYFVPDCNVRLLSPQHWAKMIKDNRPLEGTGCMTTSRSVKL